MNIFYGWHFSLAHGKVRKQLPFCHTYIHHEYTDAPVKVYTWSNLVTGATKLIYVNVSRFTQLSPISVFKHS